MIHNAFVEPMKSHRRCIVNCGGKTLFCISPTLFSSVPEIELLIPKYSEVIEPVSDSLRDIFVLSV